MISNISTGLSVDNYSIDDVLDRGKKLEELLTTACEALGEIGSLTENKADIEFLLNVVGSYLISKNNNSLPEDVKHPYELFNDNLFPMLDTVEVGEEVIGEDDEV